MADQEFEDEKISPDDVIQVIELDDNGVVSDVLNGFEIVSDEENDQNEYDDIEDMETAVDEEEIKDMADLVFDKHTDAVFTVSLDPKTCDLAVTGGQDDQAFVWKLSSGEVVINCTGYKDSVTCSGFSHDGAYVAAADYSGIVKVWKVDTREEVFTFDCSEAEWLKWHPASHVLFLGTVDGEVWMWKIPSGECKTFQGHGCAASCGLILADGKRMCLGYGDGSVKIWDLKSNAVLHNIADSYAHKTTVLCMDSHLVNNIVLTGSEDVTAKIINCSSGKVMTTLDCSSPGYEGENSVEAVGLSPTHNFAATGTVIGCLAIWDTSTNICRHQCHTNAGIESLQWDKTLPLIYTGCLDGIIRLWDARNGQVVSKWTGHTDKILGFDISKDGKSLVTVSDDKTARVFSLTSPER